MLTDLHYCPFTLLAARYFPDKDKFKVPFYIEKKNISFRRKYSENINLNDAVVPV